MRTRIHVLTHNDSYLHKLPTQITYTHQQAMAALWKRQTTSVVHRLDDPTKPEKNTLIANLLAELKKDATGTTRQHRRKHGVAPYMDGRSYILTHTYTYVQILTVANVYCNRTSPVGGRRSLSEAAPSQVAVEKDM